MAAPIGSSPQGIDLLSLWRTRHTFLACIVVGVTCFSIHWSAGWISGTILGVAISLAVLLDVRKQFDVDDTFPELRKIAFSSWFLRSRRVDAVSDAEPSETPMRLAYMMSRFPKLTETFVLREMVEMERLGTDVRVYPLQRERTSIVHPEATAFVERACFTPWLSTAILFSNAKVLLRNPGRYLSTLLTLLRVNFGWTRYLSGAILFFPKVVHLSERMRKDGVQHLHAHFASHPAMAAWVIHRLAGIPYSFTAHGSDLHCDRHMLREKVADAAVAVTISDYNRQLIIAECGADWASKVHVVRCGIDPKVFPARTAPTNFDRGLGPFRMVCVGTLHEVKGQQYLLQACRRLADKGLSFVCHLVGDGPDREMLEKLAAELGIAARCKFHGKCTGPEIQQLLADIDVIVAPSVSTSDGRREGIPVVLMEGLGSAIAAIGSDLSGIPELVRHEQTGLLTPPRDATAIADAILRIATDHQLRHQLAAAGCELVQKEFNVSRNTAALLSLIEGVLPQTELE